MRGSLRRAAALRPQHGSRRTSSAASELVINSTLFPAQGAETKPPLLIMHGLLGSSANFRTIATNKDLNTDRSVVTLDLRNHGRSGHSDDASVESMAGDLLRVVSDHGGRCAVLGHSLGGKVAMTAALLEPECFSHLLVADIAPVSYGSGAAATAWKQVAGVVEAVARTDPGALTHRSGGDAMLAEAGVHAAYRGFILQNLVPVKGGGYEWRCNVPVLLKALPQFAAFRAGDGSEQADIPTTFIRGELSDYVSEERDSETIQKLFPGARIETVRGAGHFLHAEKPTEFVSAVVEALRR